MAKLCLDVGAGISRFGPAPQAIDDVVVACRSRVTAYNHVKELGVCRPQVDGCGAEAYGIRVEVDDRQPAADGALAAWANGFFFRCHFNFPILSCHGASCAGA